MDRGRDSDRDPNLDWDPDRDLIKIRVEIYVVGFGEGGSTMGGGSQGVGDGGGTAGAGVAGSSPGSAGWVTALAPRERGSWVTKSGARLRENIFRKKNIFR